MPPRAVKPPPKQPDWPPPITPSGGGGGGSLPPWKWEELLRKRQNLVTKAILDAQNKLDHMTPEQKKESLSAIRSILKSQLAEASKHQDLLNSMYDDLTKVKNR